MVLMELMMLMVLAVMITRNHGHDDRRIGKDYDSNVNEKDGDEDGDGGYRRGDVDDAGRTAMIF